MSWFSLQDNWNDLRCRVRDTLGAFANDASDGVPDRCDVDFLRRCGISEQEATRSQREWIKEPGVLDDWNDSRSILDL